MPFDDTYYRFISTLDRVQREALDNVSKIFWEYEESSSEQDQFSSGSELPKADFQDPEDVLGQLKTVPVDIAGPKPWMPDLNIDSTGIVHWNDPFLNNTKFKCPAIITNGRYAGQQCLNEAGRKTDHLGIGRCVAHGGAKKSGRAEAGWIFMHAMSLALNVSPWDALLGQIRLLAGQVHWLTEKMGAEAISDEDLLPDGNAFYWMTLLEERGKRLAQVSKMAIDAGIAERMITLMEDQASILNNAVKQAAIELDLDEKAQYKLLTTVAKNFQELEAQKH